MIYGFVQDSFAIEILKRQKERIVSYADSHTLSVNAWLDPASFDLEIFKDKDILLVEKTFRLGKDVRSISATLQCLLSKGVVIYSCEDDLSFGGDYKTSSVMAHAFGVVADIAQEVRSQLTKEALRLRKQAGRKLGRPLGSANKNHKLDGCSRELRRLLGEGVPMTKVARKFNVDINTLRRYLKLHPKIKAENTV